MRTFDDIIPPSRRKEGAEPGQASRHGSSAPRGRFPFLTVIIALLVIGAAVIVMLRFSGAEVKITPVAAAVSVNQSFTAGGSDATTSYRLITAQKADTSSIPASGTKQVSASASGKIAIYNTQSKPQKLITNTRFASSEGLIFRIHSAVTVPAGSPQKPGSIIATAYADAPGPSYNIGPSSFTVPGLAGTPQESAVYARSAEAMTGGASGTIPVVDAEAERAAVKALEDSLATELAAVLPGEIPDGYLFIPGASAVSYRELAPAASAASGQADIQVEGTITAAVFPKTVLASAIASAAGTSDFSSGATFGQKSSLTLAPSGTFPTVEGDAFAFSLSGTADLIAAIDAAQIASAVAGKSRSEAQIALTNYPSVKSAILVLRPFWKSAFPEDPSAIKVLVISEEK